jgi:hypothetical protein
LAIAVTPQEARGQSMMLSTITLKLKHRFQFDNSIYKIQSIVGDEVSAVCVYDEKKW